jgi:hypothetical protein
MVVAINHRRIWILPMRLLLPLAVSLTLIGCASTKTDVRNEAQISQYDPSNTARVRLITGDTTHAGFISGQTCEAFYNDSLLTKTPDEAGWQTAHVDSAGLYPFRATDSQNSVVGMPASKASKAMSSRPENPLLQDSAWAARRYHAFPHLSRSFPNPAKTMKWNFK